MALHDGGDSRISTRKSLLRCLQAFLFFFLYKNYFQLSERKKIKNPPSISLQCKDKSNVMNKGFANS